MINTVNTKAEQLNNGYFKIGSGNEWLLIVGSCRAVPYCNYFNDWNQANGNRFTICFIDPFNWCFDLNDKRVSLEDAINQLETDERILYLLKRTDIIVHEYYGNFGMFNFDKSAPKNIYQFGLNAKIDICIPNWNDLFVLFGDIVTFDSEMRRLAFQDFNVIGKLSEQTEAAIMEVSQNNLRKFGKVCYLSDIPEMANYFLQEWLSKRFFHSYNHVAKPFTLAIFKFINDKWFNGELSVDENHEDMFANSYTKLTEYDIKNYKFDWGEEITDLKDRL